MTADKPPGDLVVQVIIRINDVRFSRTLLQRNYTTFLRRMHRRNVNNLLIGLCSRNVY